MRKHFFFSLVLVFTIGGMAMQKTSAQNTSPYWSMAGNSNATLSNKLGTTSNVSLRIVTNNTDRIKVLSTGNVGIGVSGPVQKLDVNGNINLAKGYGLYMENRRVLHIDSALSNVFLGNGAGAKSTGNSNTAIGYAALQLNQSGNHNTATGFWSLRNNTTGGGNVAYGGYSLYSNTTGAANVATGLSALSNNSQGSYNTASGQNALYFNTTGSYNTAAGNSALIKNTIGSHNTAVGYEALYGNVSGGENTAIGFHTMDATDGSWGNTAIGSNAGYFYKYGWNNTFIGAYATGTHNDIYNSVALGSSATVTASNQVRIGNSYTTSIGGYANWTNISDGRVKKNIQENVPGLAFINKLHPVTYNLDLDAADKILAVPAAKDKDGKTITKQPTQMELAARQARQQIVYTGFVAQDVEKAAKELNYNFSGVDVAKREKDLYGLRYTDFIMPLVKAVQELSKQNDAAKEETRQLKEQLANQQQQLAELRQIVLGQKNSTIQSLTSPSAYLKQNTPNPANSSTRISYTLPSTTVRAQLLLTDNAGKTIRMVSLSKSGFVDIDTTGLSSGVYNYSLIINGNVAETKRLEVVH